mgnify:CR=1 FL=1|nr:MAG TPA: hypothetical protein [Caudoviricetes sp.]
MERREGLRIAKLTKAEFVSTKSPWGLGLPPVLGTGAKPPEGIIMGSPRSECFVGRRKGKETCGGFANSKT